MTYGERDRRNQQVRRERLRAEGGLVHKRTPEGAARKVAASKARWRSIQATPAGRAAHRAHMAVHRAIKRGVLVRPERCERCERPGPIEAAHADYAQPLVVRWLCRSCHRLWDHRDPKGVYS